MELDLTEDLQRRLEFVEWHDRVDSLYSTIKGEQWIDLNKLEVVVLEGVTKGFAEVDMPEITRVVSLYRLAEGLQKEVKDVLQCLESGKETKELAKIIQMNEKIQDTRVRIEEAKDLVKVI